MRKFILLIISFQLVVTLNNNAEAQQYKLRQSTGIMGMKTETTIYVKGMRKRTETAGMMGMSVPTTIEQCDLQRTIKFNDKKKLYFIEPFANEEVIDEDVKPATKTKPVVQPKTTEKGGVIHMWYTITDTGERKKMNGFTARHIWTTQKMKPSADACMMKDSMIIKTDGWYIDLPEFNCPVRYTAPSTNQTEKYQPECKDRFVSHRSGKGKLGFPLTETRTIIMGNGKAQTSDFTTNMETLEFSSPKLDSMLFVIPPGYTQTMDESDLQDKMDMKEMMNQIKNQNQTADNSNTVIDEQKKAGMIRIGVYEPKNDAQLQASDLQQHLVNNLSAGNIEALAIATEEDARKYNCDYTLTTDFVRIKSGSKVGGLLKAIKNTDPNAASSYNIEANMVLIKLTDGSTRLQPKVNGKYDGKIDDAAKKALNEGSSQVLKGLK
jgi:hypothetical protein